MPRLCSLSMFPMRSLFSNQKLSGFAAALAGATLFLAAPARAEAPRHMRCASALLLGCLLAAFSSPAQALVVSAERNPAAEVDTAIKQVQLVSETSLIGGARRQLRIHLDPARLAARPHWSLERLAEAFEAQKKYEQVAESARLLEMKEAGRRETAAGLRRLQDVRPTQPDRHGGAQRKPGLARGHAQNCGA